MKSLSQVKVSTISFLLALLISLAVFGTAAYFAISGLSYNEEEKTAKGNKTGIWKGRFMRPELYRALNKSHKKR